MIEIHHTDGRITIKGHAGYAEPGRDIVCAAISALTQVFIASVEELTEDEIKYDIGKAANDYIEYRNLSTDAQLLMDSFFIGVQMIAESYPEHVRVSEH